MDTGRVANWAVARRPLSRCRGVYMGGRSQSRRGRTEMGKIIMSEFVSLDGVIQDPDGNEGFRLGGWFGRLADKGREEVNKIKGDEVTEVSKLKQELNGDIVVYASFQLLRTLFEHDLVDELRLMIIPVVLG